jgi:hypothetical protein
MGTLLYALGPLSPTYYIVRRAIISLQRQLNSSEAHKVAPPPHPLHVESRTRPQKNPSNPNGHVQYTSQFSAKS